MDIFQTLSTSNFSNYTTNYFRSFSDFIYSHKIINGSFLNILCCNIRSVNSDLDELLLFLENDKKNMLLDIIILTETVVIYLYVIIILILLKSKRRNNCFV